MNRNLPLKKNSPNERVLEPDIKTLVLNKLFSSGKLNSRPLIVNELTLNNFSRRVDLAVFENNCFSAFEIKSESDSLSRLEGQTKTYLEYFDKVIVVAASKHIQNVKNIVPENVGIWEIRDNKIIILKRGKIRRVKEPIKLIQTMKVDELAKLATKENLSLKTKNRKSLENALSKTPVKRLRSHVYTSLLSRFNTGLNQFYDAIYGRTISNNDLDILSRFKAQKKFQHAKKAKRKEQWAQFLERTEL